MEKDYHKPVYNKLGQPENKLQFGKMLRVKTSEITGSVMGKIAIAAFLISAAVAIVVSYQSKHG